MKNRNNINNWMHMFGFYFCMNLFLESKKGGGVGICLKYYCETEQVDQT